jgi:hypothetical protein
MRKVKGILSNNEVSFLLKAGTLFSGAGRPFDAALYAYSGGEALSFNDAN